VPLQQPIMGVWAKRQHKIWIMWSMILLCLVVGKLNTMAVIVFNSRISSNHQRVMKFWWENKGREKETKISSIKKTWKYLIDYIT
jgi:hypothetical protein